MATLFDPLAYERGAQAAQEANWRDTLNQMRVDTNAEALRQSQQTYGLNFPIAQQQAQLTGDLLTQQGFDLAAQRRAAETQTQLLGEVAGLTPAEQAQRIAGRVGERLAQLSQTPGDRSAQSEIRAYQDYIQRIAAGYDQARDFESAARLRGIFAGAPGQSPLQQQITAGTAANAAYQRGERFFFNPETGQTMVLPENPAIAQAQLNAQNQQLMAQLRERGLGDRYIQVGNQLVMLPPGVPQPAMPALPYPPIDLFSPPSRGAESGMSLPVMPAPAAPPPQPVVPRYSINSTNAPLPAAVSFPLGARVAADPIDSGAIKRTGDWSLGAGDALRMDMNTIPERLLADAQLRYGPAARSVLLGPKPIPVNQETRDALVKWLRTEMDLTRRLNQLPRR